MEISVQQRSPEWFDLRKSVQLTASNFGEALGVGRGKPYDFFVYYLTDEEEEETSSSAQHGITMEVVISEIYQLLTGNEIRETGFWVPVKGENLDNLVGVSPDSVVIDKVSRNPIGLCEFKAPVFSLYNTNIAHGIPRHYMAQMQGQMGVSKLPWCDFLAVCVRSQNLMLKRVHFCREYWTNASEMLREFCLAVKEVKQNGGNIDQVNSEIIKKLKQRETNFSKLLPGESEIKVDNLLKINTTNKTFCGPSDMWLTFDFLMGSNVYTSSTTEEYRRSKIEQIDKEIKYKGILSNTDETLI